MANPSQFGTLFNDPVANNIDSRPTVTDAAALLGGPSSFDRAAQEQRRLVLEAKRELDPSYQGETIDDFLMLNPEANEQQAAEHFARMQIEAEQVQANAQAYRELKATSQETRDPGTWAYDQTASAFVGVNETLAGGIGLAELADNFIGGQNQAMREAGEMLGESLGLREVSEEDEGVDRLDRLARAFTSSDGLVDLTTAIDFFRENADYWRNEQSAPIKARKELTNQMLAQRAEARRVASEAYVAEGGNSTIAGMERLMGDFTDALTAYGSDPVLLVDAVMEESLSFLIGGVVAKGAVSGGLRISGSRKISERVQEAADILASKEGQDLILDRAARIVRESGLSAGGHAVSGKVTERAIATARRAVQKEVHERVGLARIESIAAGLNVGLEAATEGILSASDVRAQIMASTPEELMESSPAYKAFIESGMDHATAVKRLAKQAFNYTLFVASALAGGTSKVTGMANLQGTLLLPGTRLGNHANRATALASNSMLEAISEGIQEGGSQMASNQGYAWALQLADEDRDLLEGVGTGAGIGAAVGGVIGGVAGYANPGRAHKEKITEPVKGIVYNTAVAQYRAEERKADLDAAMRGEYAEASTDDTGTSTQEEAPVQEATEVPTAEVEVGGEPTQTTEEVATEGEEPTSTSPDVSASMDRLQNDQANATPQDVETVLTNVYEALDGEGPSGNRIGEAFQKINAAEQYINAQEAAGKSLGSAEETARLKKMVMLVTRGVTEAAIREQEAQLKTGKEGLDGTLGSSGSYDLNEIKKSLAAEADKPTIRGNPARQAEVARKQAIADVVPEGTNTNTVIEALATPTSEGINEQIRSRVALKKLLKSGVVAMGPEAQTLINKYAMDTYGIEVKSEADTAALEAAIDADVKALGVISNQLIGVEYKQDVDQLRQDELRKAVEAKAAAAKAKSTPDETSPEGSVSEDTEGRQLTPREQLEAVATKLGNVSGTEAAELQEIVKNILVRGGTDEQLMNVVNQVRARIKKIGVDIAIPTRGVEKRSRGEEEREVLSEEEFDRLDAMIMRGETLTPEEALAHRNEAQRRANQHELLGVERIVRKDGELPDDARFASGTIAFLDLDGLGWINGTMGHATGDQALVSLVEVLSAAGISKKDIFALGGDEFVVAGTDPEDLRLKLLSAQMALGSVVLESEFKGKEIRQQGLGFSFGISTGDIVEADAKANDNKKARTAAGLRAPNKGDRPIALGTMPQEDRLLPSDLPDTTSPEELTKLVETLAPDELPSLDELVAQINPVDANGQGSVDGDDDPASDIQLPSSFLEEHPTLADTENDPNTPAKIAERSIAPKLLSRLIKPLKALPKTLAGAMISTDNSLEERAKHYARRQMKTDPEARKARKRKYQKLALIKKSRKAIPATNQEEMSKLVDTTAQAQLDAIEQRYVDEYLNTQEGQRLSEYNNLISSFKEKLARAGGFALNAHRRSLLSRSGDGQDAQFNFERNGDLFLAFLVGSNGVATLPTLARNAVTTAGLAWLLESGPLSLSDPNTAFALANKTSSEDLTTEEQELKRAGSPVKSTLSALGRQLLKDMGIQYNMEGATGVDQKMLELSAGSFVLDALTSAGMVTVETKTVKDMRPKDQQKTPLVTEHVEFDGKGNATITTVKAVTKGSVTYMSNHSLQTMPKFEHEVTKLREMHEAQPEKALIGKSRNRLPTKEPVKVRETHGGDRHRKLSAARKKANEVMNNDAQEPARDYLAWLVGLFPTLKKPHPSKVADTTEDRELQRLFGIDYDPASASGRLSTYEQIYSQHLAELMESNAERIADGTLPIEELESVAVTYATSKTGGPANKRQIPLAIRARIRGQIIDRLGEIRGVRWLVGQMDSEDPFYTDHVHKATRIFMQNTGVSPQDSHFIRWMMQSTTMNRDYELDNDEHVDLFFAAVAEGLGFSPEGKADLTGDWKSFVEERLSDPKNADLAELAELVGTLTADPDNIPTDLRGLKGQAKFVDLVDRAVPEDRIQFSLRKRSRVLNTLTELAKFRKAESSNDSTFKSVLRTEADATNSGVALAQQQYGVAIKNVTTGLSEAEQQSINDLAAAVGFYLETSDSKSISAFAGKAGKDLYVQLGSEWANYAQRAVEVLRMGPDAQADFYNGVREIMAASGATPTAQRNATEGLMKMASMTDAMRQSASTLLHLTAGTDNFDAQSFINGLVSKLERDISKGPLMTSAYSAGVKSIIAGVTLDALDNALKIAALEMGYEGPVIRNEEVAVNGKVRTVVFDTETTTQDPSSGEVISLGYKVYEDGKPVPDGAGEFRFKPKGEISAEATAVHGLTAEDLANEASFAEQAEAIVALLKGSNVVAHNVNFDLTALDKDLRSAGQPTLTDMLAESGTAAIDTLHLVRNNSSLRDNLPTHKAGSEKVSANPALEGQPNVSLDGIIEAMGGAARAEHNALEDVEFLAQAYFEGSNDNNFKPIRSTVPVGTTPSKLRKQTESATHTELKKAFKYLTGVELTPDTYLTNAMIDRASDTMMQVYGTPLDIANAKILGATIRTRTVVNNIVDAENRIYIQQRRKYLASKGVEVVDQLTLKEKKEMEDMLVEFMPRVPTPLSQSRDEWANLTKIVPDQNVKTNFPHDMQDTVPAGFKRPKVTLTTPAGKIAVDMSTEAVDNVGVRAAVNGIQNMDSDGQTFVVNYLYDKYGITLQNQHDASIVSAMDADKLLEAYAAYITHLQKFDFLAELSGDFYAMLQKLTPAERNEIRESFSWVNEEGEKSETAAQRVFDSFTTSDEAPDITILAANDGNSTGDYQIVRLRDPDQKLVAQGHYSVNNKTISQESVQTEVTGGIAQVLNSSADSEFIDTEDADVSPAVYLDSEGVISTFDRLESYDDAMQMTTEPQHGSQLRRIIGLIANRVIDPAMSFIYHERTKGDRNFGNFQHKGAGGRVVVNLAEKAGFKFGMTAKEVYTHEMLHASLHTTFLGGGPFVAELTNLYAEAKQAWDEGKITVEDFLDSHWKGSNQTVAFDANGNVILDSEYAQAYKVAQDRANHIFHNDSPYVESKIVGADGVEHTYTITEGVAEFAVLTVTNLPTANALTKVAPPKTHLEKAAARQEGFVGKVLLWWDGLIDQLARWFTSTDVEDNNIVDRVDSLVTGALRVQEKTIEEENIMERADETVRKLAHNHILGAITRWAENHVTNSAITKPGGLAKATTLAKAIYSLAGWVHKTSNDGRTMNEVIQDAINYLYRNVADAHKKFIYRATKEIAGFSQRARHMEALNRLTNKVVDQARQNITRVREQQLADQFSRKLTEQELHDLSVLLRVDISLLLNEPMVPGSSETTWEDMQDLLSSSTARVAAIAQLENEISSIFGPNAQRTVSEMLGYTQGLATFQLTGQITLEMQPTNAYGVSRQFYKNTRTKMSDSDRARLERAVDKLASIYALHDTLRDGDRNTRLKELTSSEAKGLRFFLETAKAVTTSAKDSLFIEEPWNYPKGRVKEVYPYGFTYVHSDNLDKKTVKALRRKGYTLVSETPIERDSDYGNEPKYVWVNRVAGPKSWQSGAFTLGEPENEGLSLIGTVRSGKSGVEARAAAKAKLDMLRKRKAHKVSQAFTNGTLATTTQRHTLAPVFNENGHVIDFVEVMDNIDKDTLLQRGHDGLQILAHTEGSNVSRLAAEEQNDRVVEAVVADYEDRDKGIQYVHVGPNVGSKNLRDIWYRIPRYYRNKLNQAFAGKMPDGEEGFYVHPEILALTFGQGGMSLSDTGVFDNPEEVGQITRLIGEMLRPLLGNRGTVYFERMLKELVAVAKETIVVKSLDVLLNNIVSNVLVLAIMGIPPWKSIPKMLEAQGHIGEYREHYNTLIRVQGELAVATGDDRVRLQSKINTLQQQLDANPIAPLIDQGMLTTLAEDIETSVGDIGVGFIERKLEPLMNLLPDGVRRFGAQIALSNSTTAGRWLSNQTQTSDLQARYVLHEDNMAKGMSFNDSIQLTWDIFVPYLHPSHPLIEAANSYGLTPFTRFPMRTTRAVAYMVRTKPVSTTTVMSLQAMSPVPVATVVEDTLVSSGINLAGPFSFVTGGIGTHVVLNTVMAN